jgi:hypothetical protein
MNNTPVTGSNENLIGTLDFYDLGSVNIFTQQPPGVDDEVMETFKMTIDFIFHALSRADWMSEFFLENYDEHGVRKVNSNDSHKKPNLQLIVGGKEE